MLFGLEKVTSECSTTIELQSFMRPPENPESLGTLLKAASRERLPPPILPREGSQLSWPLPNSPAPEFMSSMHLFLPKAAQHLNAMPDFTLPPTADGLSTTQLVWLSCAVGH